MSDEPEVDAELPQDQAEEAGDEPTPILRAALSEAAELDDADLKTDVSASPLPLEPSAPSHPLISAEESPPPSSVRVSAPPKPPRRPSSATLPAVQEPEAMSPAGGSIATEPALSSAQRGSQPPPRSASSPPPRPASRPPPPRSASSPPPRLASRPPPPAVAPDAPADVPPPPRSRPAVMTMRMIAVGKSAAVPPSPVVPASPAAPLAPPVVAEEPPPEELDASELAEVEEPSDDVVLLEEELAPESAPGEPSEGAPSPAGGAPVVKPPPPPKRDRRPPSAAPPEAPPPSLETSSLRPRKPWWEEAFSDEFSRALARPSDRQTAREATFIEEALGVATGGVLLDLACGAGYHAVELSRRGYGVVGYDLSLFQLALAAEVAQEAEVKLNFLQGDMREMAFEEMFDGVYCWNASFGYFEEEKNLAVISRVFRALRPGGMFLLDVPNRDFIASRLPSSVWFSGDACLCMDEASLDFITSRLKVKRSVIFDDGGSRELICSIRTYSLHELGKLLHDVGFRVVEVSGDIHTPGAFFGANSERILVLAQKP